MSSTEAPQLLSNLARESRKAIQKAKEDRVRLDKCIEAISTDDRELIKENIEWTAKYIQQNYKFSPQQIRRILEEMLTWL